MAGIAVNKKPDIRISQPFGCDIAQPGPQAIAVERLGNPNLRKRNLRPDLDVRLCLGSPYPQAPALDDADTDEQPLPF